ncbi:MAG: LCP family protein [Selenomonadaceae bacterium]|nr:LCP family protein [Selenomonadaceae bacterium]MBQ4495221.1 LCP family protein [Selenomonadaceae bacterium]MBQ6757903.1 LCP family protein [Selenomonadaceae bacterium]MBR6713471.1 LCP family protein [Selenomonadaceae bacterium]
MANETKNNIEKKRKSMRRRRRIKAFRLVFALVILCLIGSAILFVGFSVYNAGVRVYNEFVEMYKGYNDRRTARVGSADPKFEGYTNILILGVDDSQRQEADTVLVLSFSNDTGNSRIIGIPRDTWIATRSYSGRLGSLYGWGGASTVVREVSKLLGISIHQYIIIDMKTFADLIDTLGGLDIYVEENMDYDDEVAGLSIHIPQGYQHLSGEEVQKYLRYKGEKLGDVGRVQRQQKFIKALYAKVLQLDTIPKLPAIADIFRNRMETSAEIFDSAHLANVLRKMSSDPPITIMIPGSENVDGAWVPNVAELQTRMSELFPMQDMIQQSDAGDADSEAIGD